VLHSALQAFLYVYPNINTFVIVGLLAESLDESATSDKPASMKQ